MLDESWFAQLNKPQAMHFTRRCGWALAFEGCGEAIGMSMADRDQRAEISKSALRRTITSYGVLGLET